MITQTARCARLDPAAFADDRIPQGRSDPQQGVRSNQNKPDPSAQREGQPSNPGSPHCDIATTPRNERLIRVVKGHRYSLENGMIQGSDQNSRKLSNDFKPFGCSALDHPPRFASSKIHLTTIPCRAQRRPDSRGTRRFPSFIFLRPLVQLRLWAGNPSSLGTKKASKSPPESPVPSKSYSSDTRDPNQAWIRLAPSACEWCVATSLA